MRTGNVVIAAAPTPLTTFMSSPFYLACPRMIPMTENVVFAAHPPFAFSAGCSHASRSPNQF
jgi:hypothetical protein